MKLRLGVIVPVAGDPGELERYDRLAHRYVPIAHARAQARQGHEVHLFFDGPRREVELSPGVRLHIVPGRTPAFRGRVIGPHLARAAARHQLDVVHVHHLLAVEALVHARSLGVPVFAEYHGGGAPRSRLKCRALRKVSEGVSGAFFPAAELRDMLVGAGGWAKQAPFEISPEISANFPAPEPRRHLGPDVRLLVVGRCEAPKDPEATLEVIEHVLRLNPRVRVTWATPGGRDLSWVRGKVAQPGLSNKVRLMTYSSREMARVYAEADVVLSTSTREIGGTVLTEALSQGTPFAAFELPTFRALSRGCEAVRLVDGRRSPELASAALDLVGSDGLRAAARRHFLERLSYDAIAGRRSKAYLAAVQRRMLLQPRAAARRGFSIRSSNKT